MTTRLFNLKRHEFRRIHLNLIELFKIVMVGPFLIKKYCLIFKSLLHVVVDSNYVYLLFVKMCVNLILYIKQYPYGMFSYSGLLILLYLNALKIQFHVLMLKIFCLDGSKWDVFLLARFYKIFLVLNLSNIVLCINKGTFYSIILF